MSSEEELAHAQLAAHFEVCQSAFGTGEVDQTSRALQACVQVSRDQSARRAPHGGTRVLAQCRTGGHVQSTRQTAVICGQDGFNQHVPHAARGARDGDGQLFQSGHLGV